MSGTERCARQARTLGPNDFRVVAGRAEVLGFVGRWQDALEETREVEAFEPLPPNRRWEVVGVIYVALGR